MIKDYNILKHHCSVNYNIKGEIKQIGNLSDNQLFVSKRILITLVIIEQNVL